MFNMINMPNSVMSLFFVPVHTCKFGIENAGKVTNPTYEGKRYFVFLKYYVRVLVLRLAFECFER